MHTYTTKKSIFYKKKEDNLSIVFFGAVRRGLDRQSRSEDTLGAAASEQ